MRKSFECIFMKYYYTDSTTGEVVGPVEEAELQIRYEAGGINGRAQVCEEGTEDWMPIEIVIRSQTINSSVTARSDQTTTVTAKFARRPSTLSIVLILGGIILLAGLYFERKGELSGEIFIVTQGAQNYKLGLVSVALYPIDTIKPYLDQKKKEAEAELARLQPAYEAAEADLQKKQTAEAEDVVFELELKRKQYLFGGFYFSNLPIPIATALTNADGHFSIKIPTRGKFVVAAKAQRTAGDSTEHYFWIINVSLDGFSKKDIMLSNNNLSSGESAESLLHTAY